MLLFYRELAHNVNNYLTLKSQKQNYGKNTASSFHSFIYINIECDAKVIRIEEKIDGYDIVISLILEKEQKSNLTNYISKRQLELIREFKKL